MAADLQLRFTAAQALAREAGQLAYRYFASWNTLERVEKGVQDLVSEADKSVETLLIERFGNLFPEDGLLGEEGGMRAVGDGLWVIDPIDGTANFLRGLPYWSISIAYVQEGRIELGVIYDPLADELFAARRGNGATRNGLPIQASRCSDIAKAIIGLGYSRRQALDVHAQAIQNLLANAGEYRRLGSAALSLAHVADGRLDGFYGTHLNSWDVLAGLLLNREAGAWTDDFLADDGLLQGNPVFVCTPGLKDRLKGILGLAEI